MKRLFLHLTVAALGVIPSSVNARASDNSPKLVVGPSGNPCAGVKYSRIQDAINAASMGAEVEVCPGLYDETLTITSTLKLTFDGGALLMPSSVPQSTTSLATGSPIAGLITVVNSEEVDIVGGVFDAGSSGIMQCAPNLMGIVYQNSSGAIRNTWVRNTQLVPALNGCQSGDGIFIQSGNVGESRVEVSGNRVDGFQKNGITANEVGTEVHVFGNVIVGGGPTTGAAQNGIQIGYGAKAKINDNFISSDVWSPCISTSQCVYFATGILIEQSDSAMIRDNSVGNNQVNIFVNGNKAEIIGNRLFGSVVLDSIQAVGNEAIIEDNRIYDSARAAIAISGSCDHVWGNFIFHADIGLLTSSNTPPIKLDGNQFVDVLVYSLDPSEGLGAPGKTIPER